MFIISKDQHITESQSGNLIYIDSDLVCTGSLIGFLERLDGGEQFMDGPNPLLHRKSGSGRRMWRETRGKTYGKFTVNQQTQMWNSGVVAISGKHSKAYLADALECMDDLCAKAVSGVYLEQFGLSLSLSRTDNLSLSSDWFMHYWGSNKEAWNALASVFLAEIHVKAMSVEQACEHFRALQPSLPLHIKKSRVQKYLDSIKKRFFSSVKGPNFYLTEQLMK